MHRDVRTRLKWLTLLYFLALLWIVALANSGTLRVFITHIPNGDKICHFLLIGGLAYLIDLSFGARSVRQRRFVLPIGSLLVGAVVVLEEISQLWLVHRTFEPADLMADAAGILVGGRLAMSHDSDESC